MKSDAFRKRADELARGSGLASSCSPPGMRPSARCAASGRCSLSSSPSRRPDLAKAVTSAARDRGLVLLSCGIYGNVIRILVPLTIDDALLERGLDLLEESLGDARAG